LSSCGAHIIRATESIPFRAGVQRAGDFLQIAPDSLSLRIPIAGQADYQAPPLRGRRADLSN
jgi:hypothetical protein